MLKRMPTTRGSAPSMPVLKPGSSSGSTFSSPASSSMGSPFGGGRPFFQGPGAGYSNEFGQAAAAGQAAKDTAAFGAMGGLGIAGQNAMAQYGASRNAALTNQAIAQANAFGQMGNSYYNTLGQLGHIGSALSAAGLNAGAQSAQGTQSSNMNFGGGGGFQWGGGGGGGFTASGPEGTIASGNMGGGYGGGGFGGNMTGGGGMNATVTRGASRGEREGMVNKGYGLLDQLRGDLNNPENQAMQLAGVMENQFNVNRAATMDPSIMNSLNAQMDAGYGALSGLYGMSDYGFNTGSQGYRGGSFSPDGGSPDYWMDPSQNRSRAPRNPGGRFRL